MILELSVDRSPPAVVSHQRPITEEDHDRLRCIDSDDEFGTVFEMTERAASERSGRPPERQTDGHRSIICFFSHEIEKKRKRESEQARSKTNRKKSGTILRGIRAVLRSVARPTQLGFELDLPDSP